MIYTPLRPTHVERLDCDCYTYQPVATKFISPVSTRHTIQARPHLLVLLKHGLSYPLVLVSAATGSGKTTLLSQWTQVLAEEHVSVAWVSLDANDNDPPCFWHVLQTAIARQLPASSASQDSTRPENASAILSSLIKACVAQQEPMVLILDDFHTITNTTIQKQMAYLIEHLPPHLHIVLSTQVDPPLPFVRLRERDQIVEIRGDALRFTYEEAAMFLREAMHLSLIAPEQLSLAMLQSLLAHLLEVLVQIQLHQHHINTIPEPGKQPEHINISLQKEKMQEQIQPQQTLPTQPLLDPISMREMEVLELMAQGASNIGIANNLVIAPATVKRHVSNILSKLQATNRTQAVACARQFGLLH